MANIKEEFFLVGEVSRKDSSSNLFELEKCRKRIKIKISSQRERVETKHKRIVRYLQDALVLLVLGGLFYSGASWQMFWKGSDAAYYQCYAVAFWQGWSRLQKLPPEQCTFLTHPDKNAMLITQNELL